MNKNYWPHFIIALVAFAVVLGVWTVRVAMDNPVQLDNSFMMKYQDVDNNYYQIERAARNFDKNYLFTFQNKKLKTGENLLVFEVKRKDGEPVSTAEVELLITRPDTTKYDRRLKAHYKEGKYVATVNLPLEGRWDVNVKVTIDDNTYRFFKFKRSTRRIIEDKLKKS
jgi:hypothetical protein